MMMNNNNIRPGQADAGPNTNSKAERFFDKVLTGLPRKNLDAARFPTARDKGLADGRN